MEKQEELFAEFRQTMAILEEAIEGTPEHTQFIVQLQNIKTKFFELITQTWRSLMDTELSIFERVEEANTKFGHTIMDMLNEFIEAVQSLFVFIRDAEVNFSVSIMEAVSQYITNKAAANEEVPEELQQVI